MEDADVHRLEAPEQRPGGLIIKKRLDDEDRKKEALFKIPTSKFGLDVLAKKLKKERESGLLTSFRDHDNEAEVDNGTSDDKSMSKTESKTKNYRSSRVETPSHTGGVSQSVREHHKERISDKSKGIYASSKDRHKKSSHKSSGRHRDRDDYREDRKRSRYDDRGSRRGDDSSRRSDRSSYRHRDEPQTPRDYGGRSSVGKTSWDDDDEEYLRNKKKRSAWDYPTPDIPHKSHPNDSVRSYRSVKAASSSKRVEDDTPRPTPAHKFNKWAADRKNSGATPRVDSKGSDTKQPWTSEEDRDLWEEEQIRLDREWYNMDEGYDDENNPFTGANADYLKKREEQIELKKRKRISAQQRQINKDNELWEKNRMITSGVVQSINVNEDFEEETVERVHLLVHHTIPPFLDGRIVFTKVMGKQISPICQSRMS